MALLYQHQGHVLSYFLSITQWPLWLSIGRFKAKITGQSHISWDNLWFPVDFSLSQPIETSFFLGWNLHGFRVGSLTWHHGPCCDPFSERRCALRLVARQPWHRVPKIGTREWRKEEMPNHARVRLGEVFRSPFVFFFNYVDQNSVIRKCRKSISSTGILEYGVPDKINKK